MFCFFPFDRKKLSEVKRKMLISAIEFNVFWSATFLFICA